MNFDEEIINVPEHVKKLRAAKAAEFGEPGIKTDCVSYKIDDLGRPQCDCCRQFECNFGVCQFYKKRQ